MNQTTRPVRAAIHADSGNAAMLRLAGDWTLASPLPDIRALASEVGRKSELKQLKVDASELGRWDSVLPAFLFELAETIQPHGVTLVADAAPEGFAAC